MMDINAWQAAGRYADVHGHRIFYIDSRDGTSGAAIDAAGVPPTNETTGNEATAKEATDKPTIVLIHGFPTSSWDWHKIWRPLRRHYRLIAMDLLGFGFSAKPYPHPYTIMEQADIVEALVAHVGLGSFHVLAHDYGDTVAQELLARQNQGIGQGQWLSLCLLNGGLFPETHRARPIQKLLLSPLGPVVNKLVSRRTFNRTMCSIFGPRTPPSATELDAFWTLMCHDNGLRVFHRLIAYMSDRKQHRERWVEALSHSQIPIALINGVLDPVSGAHMVARYRELIVSVDKGRERDITELADIGHYPQVEDPKRVSDSYLGFLSANAHDRAQAVA